MSRRKEDARLGVAGAEECRLNADDRSPNHFGTQGGVLRLKPGRPVDGYRIPTIDWRGPPDLALRIALWAIGGYVPDRNIREYRHTPQLKSLKSSLSRAMTRLVQRGMITFAVDDDNASEAV